MAAHGQTLFHEPPNTIQWFDLALLAAQTQCRVVGDFRRADLMHAILEYQKRDRRFGGLNPEGEHSGRDESVETVGTIAR